MIGSKCNNAQLGYTKETSLYVKENKENLPNISIEEIKGEQHKINWYPVVNYWLMEDSAK